MKTTSNLHPARLPGLNLTTTTITSWRPRRLWPTIMACLGFLLTVPFVRADSPPQILKTSISGTTLTILGQNLPTGPLVVKFNNVTLPFSYSQPSQTITATLPSVPPAGTYLLSVSKSVVKATANVTIGTAGPQGRLKICTTVNRYEV